MENKKRLDAFFQVKARFIQECGAAHKSTAAKAQLGKRKLSETVLRAGITNLQPRWTLRKSVGNEAIINCICRLAVFNKTWD